MQYLNLKLLLQNSIMESDADELVNIDPDSNHFDTNKINFKAYEVDEFTKCIFQKDDLNIFHHNARSLMKEGRMEEMILNIHIQKCSFYSMGLEF